MIRYDYVRTRREDVRPMNEKQQAFGRRLIRLYTRLNVWVYRKSRGRLMKNFPGGYPICLLRSKGAKSGRWREVALIHLPRGNQELLVASQGGMDRNPSWFYNVSANPDVEIFFSGTTRRMRARRVSDEEKAALWPHLLSLYPDFDEYQARTDRNIPVFVCDPVE